MYSKFLLSSVLSRKCNILIKISTIATTEIGFQNNVTTRLLTSDVDNVHKHVVRVTEIENHSSGAAIKKLVRQSQIVQRVLYSSEVVLMRVFSFTVQE